MDGQQHRSDRRGGTERFDRIRRGRVCERTNGGAFGWSPDVAGHTLSPTYTPEPGDLALLLTAARPQWFRRIVSPLALSARRPAFFCRCPDRATD
jgi:hypothetical protein